MSSLKILGIVGLMMVSACLGAGGHVLWMSYEVFGYGGGFVKADREHAQELERTQRNVRQDYWWQQQLQRQRDNAHSQELENVRKETRFNERHEIGRRLDGMRYKPLRSLPKEIDDLSQCLSSYWTSLC